MSYEVLLSDRLFCGLDGPITSQRSMALRAGRLVRMWKSRAVIAKLGLIDLLDLLACFVYIEGLRVLYMIGRLPPIHLAVILFTARC